jgi:hypothetical protein
MKRTPLEEKLWQEWLHPQFETSQLFYGFACGAVFAWGLWTAWLFHVRGGEVWWSVMYLLTLGPAAVAIIAYQRVRKALQAEVAEFAKMVRCRWGASEPQQLATPEAASTQ